MVWIIAPFLIVAAIMVTLKILGTQRREKADTRGSSVQTAEFLATEHQPGSDNARGPLRKSRHRLSATLSHDRGNSEAPPVSIMSSKRHLWLLDVADGERLANEQIENELSIKPKIGWYTDGSMIMAVLVVAGCLKCRKDGTRISIEPEDYTAAQIAVISQQAIPLFAQDGEAWIFRGFYRFIRRPTAQSVACCKILGPPPELIARLSKPDSIA